MGALPGLGPVKTGVAILIPVTFTPGLRGLAALILLVSVYYVHHCTAARIPSILCSHPQRHEPAVMTDPDG